MAGLNGNDGIVTAFCDKAITCFYTGRDALGAQAWQAAAAMLIHHGIAIASADSVTEAIGAGDFLRAANIIRREVMTLTPLADALEAGKLRGQPRRPDDSSER